MTKIGPKDIWNQKAPLTEAGQTAIDWGVIEDPVEAPVVLLWRLVKDDKFHYLQLAAYDPTKGKLEILSIMGSEKEELLRQLLMEMETMVVVKQNPGTFLGAPAMA